MSRVAQFRADLTVNISSLGTKLWRPRRDLNPRYRRERVTCSRNVLNSQGTDGYNRNRKSPETPLSNPY
jgi:hypothetical protein